MGGLKPDELPATTASPHVFYGISLREVSGRTAVATE
jgi:hypothetical protein